MISRSMKSSQSLLRRNVSVKKIPKLIAFLALTTTSGIDSFTAPNGTLSKIYPSIRMAHSSSSSAAAAAQSTTEPASMAIGTTWSEDAQSRHSAMERCIVPLSASSYKGSSGRVGVLGGSARYTGAPYYAAMASLKCGADLAFCFCAEEAAIPIKSYSPELMVAPVYNAAKFDQAVRRRQKEDDAASDGYDYDSETEELVEELVKEMVEEVCSIMDKMHVLVVGPGLGRCPLVLKATARIIQRAQSCYRLPLVIDADGLFLLTLPEYRETLLSNESPVILTPNAMELKRLSAGGHGTEDLPESCWIIEKGAVDSIRPASSTFQTPPTMICGEQGGLKRSGGIGDVLAGTCGTLVAWNNILSGRGKSSPEELPLACWTACSFVKRATKVAFDKHRRSMTAPDILQELGPVIDDMTNMD